jgi:hypothetical protein
MNQIKDPPLNSDFGYEFNYALWTEGTRVSLVNVPWNNDYRDVVKFASRNALNSYITSIENADYVINDLAYVKPNEPIRIDLPFNKVYRFNYLKASNPIQPIPGNDTSRDFYYFITDVRYLAPNTTEIVVQLDVFQTFIYDISFGNCYIERGHIGIANTKAFDNYGRDYLTIPEGIDLGNEYQIVTKRNKPIMASKYNSNPAHIDNTAFNILVVSTVNLKADPGTVTAPELHTAEGGDFFGFPSGASMYVWETPNDFQNFMAWLSDKPWVSQGIISITAIPPIKRYDPDFEFNETGAGELFDPETDLTEAPESLLFPLKYSLFSNWRTSTEILNYIPERYRHLKKFLTSPYMMIELTTFSGTPIAIRPEAWADASATVVERVMFAPPGQRVMVTPFKYNALSGSDTDHLFPGWENVEGFPFIEGGDDNGEWLDMATSITNFPSAMIVNNGAIAYLASNRNAIAFQRQSAAWEQQRALRGNEVSYDQASSGMRLANDLTQIGTAADMAQTMLGNQTMFSQGLVGGIGGVLGGAGQGAIGGAVAGPQGAALGAGIGAVGGGISALTGAFGAGIQAETNARAQAMRAAAANAQNNSSQRHAGYVRDTNKNLADWAARGDYENSIAGINAKVQDAQLIQPTTSGQVGGDAFLVVHNSVMLSARFKMIDRAAIAVIGEYWLRYGYAVRRFGSIPVSLMTMTKFTYWKLQETYIIGGPMPESFKQAIRGIFEKGVTVWASPADIGNIDLADNEPIGGITL